MMSFRIGKECKKPKFHGYHIFVKSPENSSVDLFSLNTMWNTLSKSEKDLWEEKCVEINAKNEEELNEKILEREKEVEERIKPQLVTPFNSYVEDSLLSLVPLTSHRDTMKIEATRARMNKWSKMTIAQRAPWEEMATRINADSKKKPISGYHVFYKELCDADPLPNVYENPFKQKLSDVIYKWYNMSNGEKDDWFEIAEKVNA